MLLAPYFFIWLTLTGLGLVGSDDKEYGGIFGRYKLFFYGFSCNSSFTLTNYLLESIELVLIEYDLGGGGGVLSILAVLSYFSDFFTYFLSSFIFF